MKDKYHTAIAGAGCGLVALGLLVLPLLTYFGLIPVVQQLTGTRLDFLPTLLTVVLTGGVFGGVGTSTHNN